MLWTSKVTECLEKSPKEKVVELERKKKDNKRKLCDRSQRKTVHFH